ncbi:MAG: PA2779 family protein [Proteobacteria bacterium]|nr:PA2779 family protein [Pseudomonadota bacterium]
MNWFRKLSLKPLAVVIILTFFVLLSFPTQSVASENIAIDGLANLESATSLRVVDTKTVSERLKSLGLNDDDINRRLDQLSDAELHHFASNSSDIYPGGSITGAIVLTAIILAAAYAYIKYTGKRVVIE